MLKSMPPRILVVDDDMALRFALSRYFRELGYEVDCAREAEEAEALLAHVRYDVILADLQLTHGHGAEGLQIVASVQEMCPWTRIVLLTAYASPDVEEEARRRGVDRVLQKPQPLESLAATVVALVGRG